VLFLLRLDLFGAFSRRFGMQIGQHMCESVCVFLQYVCLHLLRVHIYGYCRNAQAAFYSNTINKCPLSCSLSLLYHARFLSCTRCVALDPVYVSWSCICSQGGCSRCFSFGHHKPELRVSLLRASVADHDLRPSLSSPRHGHSHV